MSAPNPASQFGSSEPRPRARSVVFSTEAIARTDLEQRLTLGDQPPELLVLHGSADAEEELVRLAGEARAVFPETTVIGCTAEGVLADDHEYEEASAIVALAVGLPGADLTTVAVDFLATREGHAYVGWPDRADLWQGVRGVLALGDPFSFPMDAWLDRMGDDMPGLPIIGGMCSGGHEPGGSCLLLDQEVKRQGAVLALLRGDFEFHALVSQGCRPIGPVATVTNVEQNVLLELDERPALRLLHDLFQTLPTSEQASFRHGLQIGILLDDHPTATNEDSVLVRNVVGCDSESEGIVVADRLQPGQRVRFHLRDEAAASADMAAQLRAAQSRLGTSPTAGLLFTCNGRGTRLFSAPHHDALSVRKQWPGLPLVGCQAAGEIGPVGERSFVHGHTASLALLAPTSPKTIA